MIRQVFCEVGALPTCASCGADYAPAEDGTLVMDHADGCSQAASIAAQWRYLRSMEIRNDDSDTTSRR